MPPVSDESNKIKKPVTDYFLTTEYLTTMATPYSTLTSMAEFLNPESYLLGSLPRPEVLLPRTYDDTYCENPAGNAFPLEEERINSEESHLIYENECEVSYMIPVPKGGKPRNPSLTPITIAAVKTIGTLESCVMLKCLLDSGSTRTMIHRRALPEKVIPLKLKQTKRITTLAGEMNTTDMVHLRDIKLPEFDKNRRVMETKALVFDKKCRYDIIFGTDFLSNAGINLNYMQGTMEWFENILQMREPWEMDNMEFLAMADQAKIQSELEDEYGDEFSESYLASPILDAKYEETSIADVVKQQTHLNDSQKAALRIVLEKHSKLFDGTLGVYPHRKFSIEVEPGAKPVHARPYSVPRIHMEVFKKELQHLVKLGVLSPQGTSEWASPTFIIPKKDGRVRWISDLRELNKVIKRKQYPLPIINEILKKRKGYAFFSKLDISMQYYTFELDEPSKDLCTIVTPFGKFRYERLPMGLKCSPDYAQEVMENIFRDLEDTDVYIDDVGAFSDSWESHMTLLDAVCSKLKDNGFTVNPLKCEWAVQETDWLGYWLTPTGLKPWKKKIDAVLKMEPPKSLKQLRGFIGAVNYYRDMWPHRSHILAPLTEKTGTNPENKTRKFVWTPEMQKAFDQMKSLMAMDAMTAYPNHNKPFVIYTDASDYQLGAMIMQDDKPVAYYSKKLTSAQKNYSTMEQELLSIVMTLKEFRSMLLGAEIHIYTDHLNLTFDNLRTQRVLRWRCFVEEYAPTLHYIKGPLNVVADTFSRLHRKDEGTSLSGKSISPIASIKIANNNANDTDESEEGYFSLFDDPELVECFLNLPAEDAYLNLPSVNKNENPLNIEYIKENQTKDDELDKWRQKYPERYIFKDIGEVHKVMVYVRPGDDPKTQWKIVLPRSVLKKTIEWYHQVTGYPGEKKLRMTLQSRFHHPDLRKYVDKYKSADAQKHKLPGRGYGELPERELKCEPFTEVAVDLIGPWQVKVRGRMYEFNALTCIDTVTNLVELVRINRKTADQVSRRFAQCWLARYPWPERCVHDNGGEFLGWEFQRVLKKSNVKSVSTSTYNPTANSVCERMHQTMGNILRTLLHGRDSPANLNEANELIDEALSICSHALRTSVHTTLGSSPGALVFNRDMFLNIPLMADWHAITTKREHVINENLRRMNKKRRRHDYIVGQKVLKLLIDPTKLGERTMGPYKIDRVHVNGTLTIELRPGVLERISIRRIMPFRENDD